MSAGHPQDTQIRALYARYLAGWNQRSGVTVSSVFADDGEVIDLDGTLRSGRLSIAADMRRMFSEHRTPTFVGIVRSVRRLADGVVVLHAVAGMVPPGADAVDPALHTVHALTAIEEQGRWKIALLQSTPARYGGRAGAVTGLTAELEAARHEAAR
ncbi:MULTISPECIES: SgcJ/EcaC family oxidoreductase [unclassified Modestobacter]|uniref:SgcJ/EcaC family oxidoreductase n=1 Tax=unclassified Modestobacter TaxID=2643866 RepID=UPI0022AAF966|nr:MULTISPECIES: SgcJ/EcaC family oxidoreductase [unclassified Modestobacter]MCZ2826970.1 SgcJ/EcaC family oxidoreductase [Modestobacter sp. VKM Ac-2981]MCZ2855334.1 SgcJ/EcaC family oxidoreductase [Modestobacter sp. VKM Ac-2982]